MSLNLNLSPNQSNLVFAETKTKGLWGNLLSGFDVAPRKTPQPAGKTSQPVSKIPQSAGKAPQSVNIFVHHRNFHDIGRQRRDDETMEELVRLFFATEAIRSVVSAKSLEELSPVSYKPSGYLVSRYLDEAKQAGGALLQRLVSMPRISAEDASATIVQAVLGALSYFVAQRVKPESGVVDLDDGQLVELTVLIADRLGAAGSSRNDKSHALASAVMKSVLDDLSRDRGKLALSSGWAAVQKKGTFAVQRKDSTQVSPAPEDDKYQVAA